MPEISFKDYETLNNRFTYHYPIGGQEEIYAKLRELGRELSLEIVRYCPVCRERSLALTEIDDCIMHANAAIARNEVIFSKPKEPEDGV